MGCSGCSIGTSKNPGGNYVGARLADAEDGKTTNVFMGDVQVKKGERILVETEHGPEFAEVTILTPALTKACSSKKAKRFLRLASDSEYADFVDRLDLQDRAFQAAREGAASRKLDLRVIKCAVGYDRRKITIVFTADKRVETRDLCRAMSEAFQTRVDAKMIGVRDETKILGGIGPCGLTLCCSTWLKSFHPVTIRMAKMQGITPNPAKLTGMCGRLKCCVAYELDGGIEAARKMSHGDRDKGERSDRGPAPPPAAPPAAPPAPAAA